MPHPTESPEWVQSLDRWHLLTPLRVLIVVLIAIALTIVIKKFVSKFLRHVYEHTVPADMPRAEARYRALSASLRAALVGVVWVTAVITIISMIGINIGGVVATATVVGGAIAFGAQTLIRDVIAGFFVLADDQFGVGDEVDLGHARGTVERVTLRTARLRDGEGGIWYVQHGSVLRVANLSKTSVAFLDVDVNRSMAYADIVTVMSTLGQRLANDPAVISVLASDPVLVGIVNVADDRYTVRMSVATQPGRREEVRRAWRVVALNAFSEELLAPPPAYELAVPRAGMSDAENA